MFNALTDSLKAKLYDFAYNPFMSSYVISWIVLNHKYLLIYFGNSTIEKKTTLLTIYKLDINSYTYPFAIALIYVFIYPAFALGFYYVTLFYNKESRKIKQKIEKQTLISVEEKDAILEEIENIQKERDAYNKEQKEMRENYSKEISNLNESIRILKRDNKALDDTYAENERIKKENTKLGNDYNETLHELKKYKDAEEIINNANEAIMKKTNIHRPKLDKFSSVAKAHQEALDKMANIQKPKLDKFSSVAKAHQEVLDKMANVAMIHKKKK